MVKQIAGRAGRAASRYRSVGAVTTLKAEELSFVRDIMKKEIAPLPTACLFPTVAHVEAFMDHWEVGRVEMMWHIRIGSGSGSR